MLAMDLEELQNTCDGGGAGDAFASKNMMSLYTRLQRAYASNA